MGESLTDEVVLDIPDDIPLDKYLEMLTESVEKHRLDAAFEFEYKNYFVKILFQKKE